MRLRGFDDVPQADARPEQPVDPAVVVQRREIAAENGAGQLPELIARVRIITPLRQRAFARQATADHDAGMLIDMSAERRFTRAHASARGHR